MQILGTPSKKSIKSIQRFEDFIQGSTKDITIQAVDTSKAIVLISFSEGNTDAHAPAKLYCSVELINATTVRVRRVSNFVGTASRQARFNIQVIEFNQVKSKQVGSFVHSSYLQNITIASIEPSKSILYFERTNTKPDDGSTLTLDYVSGKIVNSTTLKFESQVQTNQTIYWQLIEFK